MQRGRFLLAAAAVLSAFCVGGAVSTSYFYSPTGDDAAKGTSAETAWKSLNHSVSLVPGDMVLLQRGGQWNDQSLTLAFAKGVTITGYGDPAAPRPLILHSLPADNRPTRCIEAFNAGDLVISGLHIAGCFEGISLRYTQANISNIMIKGCVFADIRQPYSSYQPSESGWARAIAIEGEPTFNVTIVNNVGIRMDTFFNAGAFINGLLIDGNTMAQCGYNCIGLGGTNMRFSNSVFLRDTSPRIFLYGTTDVIVGTVSGTNVVENVDFVQRGEYEAAPDGCALDFETSATGFQVTGCTFYRSWGAGIMIFGHATTSQGLLINKNNFVSAGCVQPRDDRGGIGAMCPGGHHPTGTIADNNFITCPNSEAIHHQDPHCVDNMTITNNTINTAKAVELPQISFEPPAPTSTAPAVNVSMLAYCLTPNATLRYTLDGSRPTEASPIVPAGGVALQWPGPNVAFNVRGFFPGMLPSPTQGVVVERRNYKPRGSSSTAIASSFDAVTVNSTGAFVRGWADDHHSSGGGVPPVKVQISVDLKAVATVTADEPRPDLVPAGAAPNADHGFSVQLDAAVAKTLSAGRHLVQAFVSGSPSCPGLCELQGSPICVVDGKAGGC